ncbi:MAG: MgtC/SapB family protein [Clostridia bacterium]|nr:MgtC/SapB family protein [Clostridia bacterium]
MKEFFINILQEHGEHFIRLVFACFCGAIIGLERSVRRKDAGIKTHIILALGAALFMMVSQFGFGDLSLTPEYRADASRIASNIVTGVSFLCAGVIFVRGASVKGLTTATGIWATAGVGMAAGAGLYVLTIFATVLIILIQILLAVPSAKIETHYSIDIEMELPKDISINDAINPLSKIIKSDPYIIKLVKSEEKNHYKLSFNIRHTIKETNVLQQLSDADFVTNVLWTAL